ncbi:MAG: MCE family protein [Leptospiraceae bacterium]|nr:MCE family protein [Leptospiraceae bacterium]
MKNYLVGSVFFILMLLSFNYTILERTDKTKLYPYKINLYLSKVEGIEVGDDVYLKGIKYGEILSISKIRYFEIPNPRFQNSGKLPIKLVLAMKDSVTLWDNYKVKFKTKTLFSARHLDLDPGSPEENITINSMKPFYKEEEEIPNFAPSLKYYDDVFGESYSLLEENKKNTRRIIVNLKNFTGKLKGKKGTIPKLINDDELYLNTEETINDIAIISKEARRYVESQREIDIIPTTFSMVIVFNILGINILSN